MKRILTYTILVLLGCINSSAEDIVVDGINYNVDIENRSAEVISNNSGYKGDIVIPSSIYYDGVSYDVTKIGDYAFWNTNITSVSMPNGLIIIGKKAFGLCSDLLSIIIPKSVKYIMGSAFLHCKKLVNVYCLPEDVPLTYIEENPFFGISVYATLHVPATAKENYIITEPWNQFGTIVALDNPRYYRPFIEEGKVWKVGLFITSGPEGYTHAHTIEYFYFDGDTIVSGQPCKKMMCREEYDPYNVPQTTYVGALYEDVRRVYCALPNSNDFVLLYDFATPEETEIEYYNTFTKKNSRGYIRRRSLCEDSVYHGMITTVNWYRYENESEAFYIDQPEVSAYWREGVGYDGFYNSNSEDILAIGAFNQIMLCTVDDEVLYYDPSLIDCVTPDDGAEVKKNTIDFTHVVKSQPKAPERSLTLSPIPEQSSPTRSLSPVGEGSEGSELTGEYSLKELFVNFKPLSGPYVITICDDSGAEVYRKEVQTSNVIGLNTDISGYEKGEYTITVENDAETYTAEFKIDDEVGINRPTPDPSLYGGVKAGANKSPFGGLRGAFDLSGRKVGLTPNPSPVGEGRAGLPRGVYIKDGRKIVVR